MRSGRYEDLISRHIYIVSSFFYTIFIHIERKKILINNKNKITMGF